MGLCRRWRFANAAAAARRANAATTTTRGRVIRWLAIDGGNSRIKWALFEGEAQTRAGGFALPAAAAAAAPPLAALARRAKGREVWLAAAPAARARLRPALAAAARVVPVAARARACGLRNRYKPPQSLGADRWLCLLGARARWRRAVVVVGAGTAITIDGLSAAGVFCGGLILPGLRNMHVSLAARARLPRPPPPPAGGLPAPANTRAAMQSGALLAAAGAALEFRRRFLPRALFCVTGGDGARLLPLLPAGAAFAPGLLFEGMAALRAAGEL